MRSCRSMIDSRVDAFNNQGRLTASAALIFGARNAWLVDWLPANAHRRR